MEAIFVSLISLCSSQAYLQTYPVQSFYFSDATSEESPGVFPSTASISLRKPGTFGVPQLDHF